RVWPAGPTKPFSVGVVSTGATLFVGGDFIGIGGVPQAFVSKMDPALSILSITPANGGNSGPVSATLAGAGFVPSTTIRLERSGQADLIGTNVTVSTDGTSLSATFDLNGKAVGAWNLVLSNPDGQTTTLSSGFSIEALQAAQLRVD